MCTHPSRALNKKEKTEQDTSYRALSIKWFGNWTSLGQRPKSTEHKDMQHDWQYKMGRINDKN